MLASMIGLDADKMQMMMTGFIDNAASLAKGVDDIGVAAKDIQKRLTVIEKALGINSDNVLLLEEKGG